MIHHELAVLDSDDVEHLLKYPFILFGLVVWYATIDQTSFSCFRLAPNAFNHLLRDQHRIDVVAVQTLAQRPQAPSDGIELHLLKSNEPTSYELRLPPMGLFF